MLLMVYHKTLLEACDPGIKSYTILLKSIQPDARYPG